MKTLVVHYTPRAGSNTQDLLNYLITKLDTEPTYLNLAENPAPHMDTETLNAYVNRNFGGGDVQANEGLAHMDRLHDQLAEHDHVVIAFPMYNFSEPASIKAWFDSVIQAGKSFAMTESGPKGLFTEKRAIVITTSGSDLSENSPWAGQEHSHSLAMAQLGFIGISTDVVYAHSTNNHELYADQERLAKEKIDSIAERWSASE